jgi:hypothetical protein
VETLELNKYGYYLFSPFYKNESFELIFQKLNSFYQYQRDVANLDSSKQIISIPEITKIYVQPSEPFAQGLDTTFLLLKLREPLHLLPESSLNGYVSFPLSLSLFVSDKEDKIHHIDTFSILKPKLALYGNPHNGIICRYWETSFSSEIPDEKLFSTGILELNINNPTSSKVEVSQLVLNFSYMEIYFKPTTCKTSARVKIISDKFAETEFITPSGLDGYEKSIDLIPTKILTSSKYLMEFGL